MNITVLGTPQFASPSRRAVRDDLRVPERIVCDPLAAPATGQPEHFE